MIGRLRLRELITANWLMKLTALALAAVLWAGVAAEQPGTRRLPVTLEVTAPPGHPLLSAPPTVFGVFAGSARELLKLYAVTPIVRIAVPGDVEDSTFTVQLVPADIQVPQNINVRPESIEPGWLTLRLEDSAAAAALAAGPPFERVIMGVPVSVRGERSGGLWYSDPPAVIVTVRGPRDRVTRMTRDSVAVAAAPARSGEPETVRLTITAPGGVEVLVTPDTAVVRRTRG